MIRNADGVQLAVGAEYIYCKQKKKSYYPQPQAAAGHRRKE